MTGSQQEKRVLHASRWYPRWCSYNCCSKSQQAALQLCKLACECQEQARAQPENNMLHSFVVAPPALLWLLLQMTFVQATTGGGGWPMSVWLTPDLKPFYGGTYYPGRYERTSSWDAHCLLTPPAPSAESPSCCA